MGRYIDDILQPGEKVLYSTNAHWIFFLPAIAAWIVALALYILSRNTVSPGLETMWLVLAAAAALVAVIATAKAWFDRWITETDVTNLRVVHKTGFMTRKTVEMSLDKIASVNVKQTLLGRIFDYGDVKIESVGDAEEEIKTIASPLKFRNSITAR
jgi:uncharacterized membrane protein YdbT with pleckstrin-like domain